MFSVSGVLGSARVLVLVLWRFVGLKNDVEVVLVLNGSDSVVISVLDVGSAVGSVVLLELVVVPVVEPEMEVDSAVPGWIETVNTSER